MQYKQEMWVKGLSTTSIVKEAMGSWKWQQPYRHVVYVGFLAKNGKVIWRSYVRGGKLSWPQIVRSNIVSDKYFSVHNRQITREEAVKKVGLRRVKQIEARGWQFM